MPGTPAAPGREVLAIEDRNRVRILRLNRPEKLNALNHALIEALLGAAADADRDAAVGAILLTGAGRAFCAGIDLEEIADLQSAAAIRAHARYAWFSCATRLPATPPLYPSLPTAGRCPCAPRARMQPACGRILPVQSMVNAAD